MLLTSGMIVANQRCHHPAFLKSQPSAWYLEGLKAWFLSIEWLHRYTLRLLSWTFLSFLNVLLHVTCQCSRYSQWNMIWVFNHEGFHELEDVLKLRINKLLTSILNLKIVNRNTALWRKQERFSCCYCI